MPSLIRLCEHVLFAEGFLNLFSGFLITFFPEFVMTQQGLPASSSLANGNLAQFGSLVMLMGYLGVRAAPTPHVIEALLFGDFLWMFIFKGFVDQHARGWTAGAHFSIWVTAFLAVTRTAYLYCSYFAKPKPATGKKK